MKENQNVEWKEIWKDEYLRWICAFANSKGGVLYIGINDNGKVIGVKNAEYLVYTIPHKVKDSLGIIVQASIKKKKNLETICIKVDAHPYPVSLKGRYYIRSGSNTYEARGVELDRLLLRKMGVRWEKLPAYKSTMDDLDKNIIDYFKDISIKNGTLTHKQIEVDNVTLLKNLRLYNGKELSLGAILLFGKCPDNWVYNSFIKICEIDSKGNISKEQKVTGSLLIQLEETLKLLYSTYNVNIDKRIMNELILNAIMHKSYDREVPTEIRIYPNKITLFNSAQFPRNITSNTIYNPHASIPYNPRIANTFNKCGLAALWGQGLDLIKTISHESNMPLPKYKIDSESVLVKCISAKEKLKREILFNKFAKEEILNYLLDERVTTEEIEKILQMKKQR